jgi:hypothetical protein
MAGQIDIKIIGLPTLMRITSPVNYQRRVSDGLRAAALFVKGRASQYPSPRPMRQPPKTDRQRRFLMAAISSGLIGVPYRRSSSMAKNWDFKMNSPSQAEVFNEGLGYPKYVMGEPGQSKYHAGNWKTDEMHARENDKEVGKIMEKAITRGFG